MSTEYGDYVRTTMMTSSLDLLKWWCWRCSVFHWLGQPLPVWRPDSFYCYLIADVCILLRAGSFSDLLLGSTPAPSAEYAASALHTNSRKQRINQRQFGFTLPSFTALMHISTLIQLKEWKEREKKMGRQGRSCWFHIAVASTQLLINSTRSC